MKKQGETIEVKWLKEKQISWCHFEQDLTSCRDDITVSVNVAMQLKSSRQEEIGNKLDGVGHFPTINHIVCGPTVCRKRMREKIRNTQQ